MGILDDIEDRFEQRHQLESYGQVVDRIMGGAKSLAMALDNTKHLDQVGNYAELCKLVGYKASQIEDNEQFFNIVHGLLTDATEMLLEMVQTFGTENEKNIKEHLSTTFLDRLKWVNGQFDENIRSTLALDSESGKKASQSEIDDLMKSLGL
ncbi:MAG: hypothetical protein R2827_02115 [Bdellovibrionales bacterium]